jgi:O-antigen/teichoic acid export membrane protein
LAVSALIGAAVARRPLSDTDARLRLACTKLARGFLIYAAPLVIANTVYSLIVFMNRSWLASFYGLAEAGQFSLAWELGLRGFVIAGSALDILLFQLAVRADEYDGKDAGERQLAGNAAIIIALLLPLAAGFWVCLPAIEALIIPTAYHGSFTHYSALLIPVFLAFALAQFALNPVFQLRNRTAPVIAAAVVCLVVNGGALFILPRWYGPSGVALAQLAGMIAALGVLGYLTLTSRNSVRLPWRDIGLSLLATAVMIGAVWPLQDIGSPLLRLIATVALGLGIYGGFVWFVDLASLRTLARRGIERMAKKRSSMMMSGISWEPSKD